MATYYVDSNATGLNDGSSWTDAWTSLASSTGATSGDTVYVSSTHSETTTTYNLSWTASMNNPVKIINVDSSTNQYTTSSKALYDTRTLAQFNAINIDGIGVRIYGIKFDSGTGISIPARDFYIKDCYFEIGYNSGSLAFNGGLNGNVGTLDGCYIRVQRGSIINFSNNSRVLFKNCELLSQRIAASTVTAIVHGASNNWSIGSCAEFRDCKINDFDYLFSGHSAKYHQLDIKMINCEFPSSWSHQLSDTISPRNIIIDGCSDASTSPQSNFRSGFFNERGVVEGISSVYRSGGASIDGTNFSWSMQSNTLAIESLGALESLPITRHVEAASQTITLYLASSSTLNDDDFWIEVESPSELSTATTQSKLRTTLGSITSTPTALTSDTSTWTGTGVGTAQKIEVPISPTIAGTVTVRCYLAKPSTTVYVDPKLSGTGYQRVYNGVLVDDNETITTTTSTAGTQIYPFRQFVSDKFGAVLHPLRSN